MLKEKYIFIHIPRTGGRSVMDAIGGSSVENSHKDVLDYCKELTEQELRNRFVFTIVRNPWERAVSWYLFFGFMDDIRKIKPFPEWVRTFNDILLKRRNDYIPMCDQPIGRFPLFEQMGFCCNNHGEVMVQTFLRYETLATDFIPVANRLGVTPVLKNLGSEEKIENAKNKEAIIKELKLPDLNLLPIAMDYKNAYTTQESIDIIAKIEFDVINRFGYIY